MRFAKVTNTYCRVGVADPSLAKVDLIPVPPRAGNDACLRLGPVYWLDVNGDGRLDAVHGVTTTSNTNGARVVEAVVYLSDLHRPGLLLFGCGERPAHAGEPGVGRARGHEARCREEEAAADDLSLRTLTRPHRKRIRFERSPADGRLVPLAARAIYAKADDLLTTSEPHRSFGKNLVGETWPLALD